MDFRFIKTDYLEMISGGDKGVVSELIDIFREQIAEFYGLMHNAYSSGNFHDLKLIAHKAKSSVAIVGMDKLAGRLRELEEMISAGETSQAEEIIIEFREETVIAVDELKQYLNKL